jgi:hypothetical protein
MKTCPTIDIINKLVVKSCGAVQYDVRKPQRSVDDCSPKDASDIAFAPALLTKRIGIYH